MHKCIYCLKEKPKSHFNKEHVIPESFGKFKENLKLKNKVCTECNQSFGDSFELQFARGTYEGALRFKHNIKKPNDFKEIKNFKNLEICLAEGKFKGMLVALKSSEAHNDLIIEPRPQIGFKKADDTYDYFDLQNLPSKDTLEKKYQLSHAKSIFVFPDTFIDDARIALEKVGINFQLKEYNLINLNTANNEVMCKITGTIDLNIRRVMAKIGFNYFAYFNDTTLLLDNQFDLIRNFIVTGNEPDWPLIKVDSEPILFDEKGGTEARLGHLITLNYADDRQSIIAHVSLFNWLRYTICLARSYRGEKPKIGIGHFFNIAAKNILPICKSSLFISKTKLLLPGQDF